MTTYGTRLKDFALASDIISDVYFRDIVSQTVTYLKQLESIDDIIIAVQKVKNQKIGLWGAWPDDRGIHSYWFNEIYNSDDTYHGQSSFVFANKLPGWFVSADKTSLNVAAKYIDLLGNYQSADIPPFVSALGTEYKTSVIYPMKSNSDVYGIINFEFKDYIVPNESWKQEFILLAEAFSVLYQLWQTSLMQSSATNTAIKQLSQYDITLPIGQPTALLFSSSRGKNDVKSEIQKILNQYSGHFSITNWDYTQEPGDIMAFIRKSAMHAILGIAYLSELDNEADKFVDNPNLLYESGLLDGIAETKKTPLKSVILIREEQSSEIPSDLRGVRIIKVARHGNDKQLNADNLKSELELRLRAIDKSWVPNRT